MALLLAVFGAILSTGCAASAYQNERMPVQPVPTRATFNMTDTRGNPDVFVALAISGGGSRSAWLAASTMFKLESVYSDVNLLEEVDMISSVSGGSLTSAYYCISQDKGGKAMRSNRDWDEDELRDILSRSFQARWIGNTFLLINLFRYFFTAYDRTDIMAQTLEDNMFDALPWGQPLTFADLNPDRPYLVINATDATENAEGEEHFGTVFTFTDEDFRDILNSDLSSYYVAWAVTASAAFPGVFNHMTLRDYRKPHKPRYIHLFDGGTSDNLGLESIKRFIIRSKFYGDVPSFKHFVVILVDSYIEGQGADSTDYDPRSWISNFFDTNIVDAFESLMKFRRQDLLGQFRTGIFDVDQQRKVAIENMTFWHIHFGDIDPKIRDHEKLPLQEQLNSIATNFSISDDDMTRIDQAVELLVDPSNPKLKEIVRVLYH
ncbi:MAG: patatin-like phospholipase family protein [Planctomycetota bacterium]|jgi:predicted acylesterase/phospholipase RssA